MFQKIAKHRANDASNDVHRPPLLPTSDHDVLDHAEQVEGLNGMSRGLLSLSQAHAVPPVSHLQQGVHYWVHERVSLGDRDLEEVLPWW